MEGEFKRKRRPLRGHVVEFEVSVDWLLRICMDPIPFHLASPKKSKLKLLDTFLVLFFFFELIKNIYIVGQSF